MGGGLTSAFGGGGYSPTLEPPLHAGADITCTDMIVSINVIIDSKLKCYSHVTSIVVLATTICKHCVTFAHSLTTTQQQSDRAVKTTQESTT